MDDDHQQGQITMESTNLSLCERDRDGIQQLVLSVASDADFRICFAQNPEAAIRNAGLEFSAEAMTAVTTRAPLALKVTEQMDTVDGSFFFFFLATANKTGSLSC